MRSGSLEQFKCFVFQDVVASLINIRARHNPQSTTLLLNGSLRLITRSLRLVIYHASDDLETIFADSRVEISRDES
jgi:hypothetical protein